MNGLSIAEQVQAIHAAIQCGAEFAHLPGRQGEILAILPTDRQSAVSTNYIRTVTGMALGTFHPAITELVRKGYVMRNEFVEKNHPRVTYWRVR